MGYDHPDSRSSFKKKIKKLVLEEPDSRGREKAEGERNSLIRETVAQATAGFHKIKDNVQEKISGTPDPADILMRENDTYTAELTKKETLEAIRNHQRAAKKNSLYREMDWAVQRAYYGDNGIRFYGELLQEYVKHILPQETEMERMWVGGYNSCIAYMRSKWEAAEEQYARWESQLADVEEGFSQDQAARRSVGYEDMEEAYQAYQACRRERKAPEALQEKLKKMERICAANRAAAETARAYLSAEPAVMPPEKEALRRALKEVLESGMAEQLADGHGMTAEDYRAVLERYAELVKTDLLEKFGIPGGDPAETE